MVFRPEGETYKVLGECFVTTLRDAAALLGPLPEPWRVECKNYTNSGTHRFYYVNTANDVHTFEDPRLEPLNGWESLGTVLPGENGRLSASFRNVTTGEIMNSDPRLLPQELKRLGVDLKTFMLI